VIDEAKMAGFRAALEEQRENLRKEIAGQGGDPDSDDAAIDVETNFADSAHSTAERARMLSVMKALRANLRWVNRALTKMELGTYGICERCGRQIGRERLDTLPWAILCIDCKQRGEGR
jgi:DnaK suppressor protein